MIRNNNGINILAIAGGSGSGKTTMAKTIVAAFKSILPGVELSILSQDSFYRDQSANFDGDGGSVNFDEPSSLDFVYLEQILKTLKSEDCAQIPIYDFKTHKRLAQTNAMTPTPVVILDGTLVLSQYNLLPYIDYSIFLNIPEETRFARRLKRDVSERGRDPEGVHKQFYKQVKPMHDLHVQPSIANATWIYDEKQSREAFIQQVFRQMGLR